MNAKAVYYPRIQSINFYDETGIVRFGMTGSTARDKFRRMLREGKWPRISLRKHVRITLFD